MRGLHIIELCEQQRLKLCLPIGTMAANWKKRRLRYSPFFGQIFGQVSACLYMPIMGVPEIKNNRSHLLLCYGTRLIHLCRV
jgi:hypothetical protein